MAITETTPTKTAKAKAKPAAKPAKADAPKKAKKDGRVRIPALTPAIWKALVKSSDAEGMTKKHGLPSTRVFDKAQRWARRFGLLDE